MGKITITVPRPKKKNPDQTIVRLNKEAYEALSDVSVETGMHVSKLASQIILGAIEGDMLTFDYE